MKNFVHPYARYTSLIGATVWPKFRTISGLPTHHCFSNFLKSILVWILMGV